MNEIGEDLFKYISIFGPPVEILSDQGKEFLNSVVDHILTLYNIDRKMTSIYNPRTNGLTERFNQTLVNAIRKHAETDEINWPKWLPFALLAYRTRIQS